MSRGSAMPGLNREKKWNFKPTVTAGTKVGPGDVIGEVQETTLLAHRIMVPAGVNGTIRNISEGEYTVEQTVAVCVAENGQETPLKLMQKWPVRRGHQQAQRAWLGVSPDKKGEGLKTLPLRVVFFWNPKPRLSPY